MSKVIVIGNWDEVYQGFCLEFEHRCNKSNVLKLPSSILQDMNTFVELLQQNQPKSVQLISQDKITLDYFFNLLTIIGMNCPQLECLGVNLNLEQAEIELDKTLIDLDLQDVTEAGVETLTPAQKTCVKAWDSFINNVKDTFQHIVLVGDMSVPCFAIKSIITKCPNIDNISGSFSGIVGVQSIEKLREVIDGGEIVMEGIVYIITFEFQLFDLEIICEKFCNLRILNLKWNSSMDLKLLENSAMVNICEIYIFNPDTKVSDDDTSDASETKNARIFEAPTVDLFIPKNSRLREFSINGLCLSQMSWEKIGNRCHLLMWIYADNVGTIQSDCISYLWNLQKLETLRIDASNYINSKDIIPLFNTIGKTRFKFNLKICKNNITMDDEIQESVLEILEYLNNETIENFEGSVEITLEYWQHVGGFDFMKDVIEEKSFSFEHDTDNMESKIWHRKLNKGNSSERSLTLIEEKTKPKCEGGCQH